MTANNNDDEKKQRKGLDDLTALNSFFSLAVFVGLSLATPTLITIETRTQCIASPQIGKFAVFFEILSFACFLLSTVMAKFLKILISTWFPFTEIKVCGIKVFKHFKLILFSLTAISSVAGLLFLTTSVAMVIIVKLGNPFCKGNHTALGAMVMQFMASIILVLAVIAVVFIFVHRRNAGALAPQVVVNGNIYNFLLVYLFVNGNQNLQTLHRNQSLQMQGISWPRNQSFQVQGIPDIVRESRESTKSLVPGIVRRNHMVEYCN